MLICGMGSSKGFRNWKAYHPQNYLYGELPNRMHCPCPLCDFLAIPYCIYHYAHAWFLCTRIFRQTFSKLAQQPLQKIRPFRTSSNGRDNNYNTAQANVNTLLPNRRWWGRIEVCGIGWLYHPTLYGNGLDFLLRLRHWGWG